MRLVVFAGLYPFNDHCSHRQHDGLHQGLPHEAHDDVVDKPAHGIHADDRRGDGAKQQSIAELAHHGGSDKARKEALFARALLHRGQRPGVEQLTHQVAGQRGGQNLRHQAKGGGEGLLTLVEISRRQPDGDIETHGRQDGHRKADIDRAPGGFEAIALGEHVADDIGQREQKEGAVGNQRAELHALSGVDIGNEEGHHKHGDQPGVEGGADGNEAHFSAG